MIKNIYKYLIDRSVINIKSEGWKGIEILAKSIKVLLFMFGRTCINMLKNFIQEEESSIRLNMMIRKFQKDIKSLSTNKIIKRAIHIVKGEPKHIEKGLKKLGINDKDAYHWSKHPVLLAETKEGKIVLGNYTSSKKVNGKETVKVGIQENGKSSYLALEETKVVEKTNIRQAVKTINSRLKDKYPEKSKEGKEIANNTSDAIEKKHGVEIKNENLESIETILKEPADKL